MQQSLTTLQPSLAGVIFILTIIDHLIMVIIMVIDHYGDDHFGDDQVILVIVSVGSTHSIVLKHLTAGLIIIIMIMVRSRSYPIKYYVDIRDCHQTKAARKIMRMR